MAKQLKMDEAQKLQVQKLQVGSGKESILRDIRVPLGSKINTVRAPGRAARQSSWQEEEEQSQIRVFSRRRCCRSNVSRCHITASKGNGAGRLAPTPGEKQRTTTGLRRGGGTASTRRSPSPPLRGRISPANTATSSFGSRLPDSRVTCLVPFSHFARKLSHTPAIIYGCTNENSCSQSPSTPSWSQYCLSSIK
ncbi:hypothetical protein EYF80_007273 [Liparis tanakae]|uniref:Uncharacterized protein n=1 Tax=Liparis tanakae TaxID=230148 RepID=A0A4Z2IY69_9TELE|nr:hypothetical protein EYF80_007273 [Liparis tanakae]